MQRLTLLWEDLTAVQGRVLENYDLFTGVAHLTVKFPLKAAAEISRQTCKN